MNIEIINAATLGFIGSMIPGPIISALFTEILQSGFRRCLKTILYALIAEFTVAFFVILVFSILPLDPRVFSYISIIGAAVLLWISKSLWKIKSIDPENRIVFSFPKMSLLTITNGLFWTYWVTVCIPKAIDLNQKIVHGKFVFLGAIEMGWLIGTVILAFLFSRFRSYLIKPKVIGTVFKIFSITFVYFALEMGFKSLLRLI